MGYPPKAVVSDRGERYPSMNQAALAIGTNRMTMMEHVRSGKPLKGRVWRVDEEANRARRERIEARKNRPRQRPLFSSFEEYAMARQPLAKRSPTIDPEQNRRVNAYSLAVYRLGPFDQSDPQQTDERCAEYMRLCDEYGIRPNVAGLACALRIRRAQLLETIEGRQRNLSDFSPESMRVVEAYYNLLNANMEASMLDDAGNPVKYIFLLKNNWGYRDSREQVTVRRDESPKDPEKLAAKYAEILGIEDADVADAKGKAQKALGDGKDENTGD